MANRIFAAQVVRAIEATPIPDAELYVFSSGTTTQKTVYASDGTTVLSQPLVSYSDGRFDPFYTLDNLPVTVLITDDLGNPLPGYPVNDIYPDSAAGSQADGVSFAPIESVPETTVQAAIEAVAALATSQDATLLRTLTAWTTGGSGNAYTITPTPAVAAVTSGMAFLVQPDRMNTAAATLNVSGIGARNIRKRSRTGAATALVAGDLQPGGAVLAIYDGTQFILSLDYGRPEAGSGLGGGYTRWPDGTQICDATVTLTFLAADFVATTWVYEKPFAAGSIPAVTVQLPTPASLTGMAAVDLGRSYATSGAVSASVGAVRSFGAPVFGEGDSVANVRVTATGRWF